MMSQNNAFSCNFLNLNLLSFFDNNNLNSHSSNPSSSLLKGNEKFVLETVNDDDDDEGNLLFKDTPIELGVLNEEFLERTGITTNGCLGGYDPPTSRGSYRQYREKKKRELDDLTGNNCPLTQYPYKPITSPIPTKLNSTKKVSEGKCLKFLHWNANSVVGKINSILNLIEEEKPDLISINETRTNSTTESYIYEMAKLGYLPFIRSRKVLENGKIVNENKHLNGGGVAILVKDSIVVAREIDLPSDKFTLEERANIEIIGVAIKVGGKEVAIFSYYNQPSSIVNSKVIEYVVSQQEFVLMGDLNSKVSKFGGTNLPGKKLDDLIINYDATIVNNESPTFYRYVMGDLISTSHLDLAIVNGSLAPKIRNFEVKDMSAVVDRFDPATRPSYFHLPLSFSIEFDSRPVKKRKSFHASYLYDRADWNRIIANIESRVTAVASDDLDQLNKIIIDSIKIEADKGIPKSNEKLKREYNYPPHIVQVLETRNFWAQAYRYHRSELFAMKYREHQTKASEMVASFRRENWQEFLKRQKWIKMRFHTEQT